MKKFQAFISSILTLAVICTTAASIASAEEVQPTQGQILSQQTSQQVLDEKTTQETTTTFYSDGTYTEDVLTVTELDIPVPYGLNISRTAKAQQAELTSTVYSTGKVPAGELYMFCIFYYDRAANQVTYTDLDFTITPKSGTKWRNYGTTSKVFNDDNRVMIKGEGKCLTYNSTRGIMFVCYPSGKLQKNAYVG